jgi:hypothetical protein
VALDVAAEADAVTADLRALAPELTVVPVIRTGRPFSGDPHPWTRRVALVACTRLARVDGAAGRWPRVAGQLPAVAVGETGAKLATGTRRPPRRPGRPRPAPAGGLA